MTTDNSTVKDGDIDEKSNAPVSNADDVLNTSFKSVSSNDSLHLRISDDESTNKHGGIVIKEEPMNLPTVDNPPDKMSVDNPPDKMSVDNPPSNGETDKDVIKEVIIKKEIENFPSIKTEIKEEIVPLVNGISGYENEGSVNRNEVTSDGGDNVFGKGVETNDLIKDKIKKEVEDCDLVEGRQIKTEQIESREDHMADNGLSEPTLASNDKASESTIAENTVALKFNQSEDDDIKPKLPKTYDSSSTCVADESAKAAPTKSKEASTSSSGPSADGPEAPMDSDDPAPSVSSSAEPWDEFLDTTNFAADATKKTPRESMKRPRNADSDSESESTTPSGHKKIRVEKRHCSDGEQEQEAHVSKTPSKKERRRSCSEADMLKDLEKFNSKLSASDDLKGDKWKAPEMSVEERKRLAQATAREKKLRENILRVIQRNYKSMSVEDFEDAVYVSIMDYFCHYNSSSLLQRKVIMLEKLVSKLQENYNRTFKQFCEAKYLLRRMVEIRKEEAKKCVCKDKIPFKLIRSVAVQVQTARCRGGDLCPGSGIGLDPNFKPGGASTSVKVTAPRKGAEQSHTPTNNENNSSALNSNSMSAKNYQSTSPPPNRQNSAGPHHISVSIPPTVPAKNMAVRQKTVGELQNGKSPAASPPVQRTARLSSGQSPQTQAVNTTPYKNSDPPPPRQSNSSIVIDLTDKDEDIVVVPRHKPAVPPPTSPTSRAKTPPASVQPPIQTRVVKTSVLSPMPQLPPLPPAPQYKPVVRRPPQPVLKVCKADQSGIMLSWTLRTNVPLTNEILFYQVYACQENAGVTREWSTVGDVKALPLPMACTLSQFREGHRYHFVVRAVDKFKVLGEFSHPASILLVSKNGGTSNHSIPASPNRR